VFLLVDVDTCVGVYLIAGYDLDLAFNGRRLLMYIFDFDHGINEETGMIIF